MCISPLYNPTLLAGWRRITPRCLWATWSCASGSGISPPAGAADTSWAGLPGTYPLSGCRIARRSSQWSLLHEWPVYSFSAFLSILVLRMRSYLDSIYSIYAPPILPPHRNYSGNFWRGKKGKKIVYIEYMPALTRHHIAFCLYLIRNPILP